MLTQPARSSVGLDGGAGDSLGDKQISGGAEEQSGCFGFSLRQNPETQQILKHSSLPMRMSQASVLRVRFGCSHG